MADDQIITLLGEIRDLQKQHVENYKLALHNQQQSIEIQKNAVRRSRVLLAIVGFFVVALYLLPLFWWGLNWGIRCALHR